MSNNDLLKNNKINKKELDDTIYPIFFPSHFFYKEKPKNNKSLNPNANYNKHVSKKNQPINNIFFMRKF